MAMWYSKFLTLNVPLSRRNIRAVLGSCCSWGYNLYIHISVVFSMANSGCLSCDKRSRSNSELATGQISSTCLPYMCSDCIQLIGTIWQNCMLDHNFCPVLSCSARLSRGCWFAQLPQRQTGAFVLIQFSRELSPSQTKVAIMPTIN